MHIVEEELGQDLIARIALETVKRGIKSFSIIKFILITSILLMMSRNHGIENHVVFFGFHNHVVVECWNRMTTRKRMRHEMPSPHQGKKKVVGLEEEYFLQSLQ